MAEALDNSDYSDLDELGVDSDELTEQFLKAAKHLQTLVSKTDSNTLLLLYGYYKQGTEGSCNIPKPKWYDTKGKSKWEAWNKLGNMSKTEAKSLYIEHMKSIDPDFLISPSKETWVTISTLQTQEKELTESEKLLSDYVKEGNVVKVVSTLSSYGGTQIGALVNKIDEDGLGLIHWAADRGFSDVLTAIISIGGDINLMDSEQQTALHYASSCGHLDCITVLLNSGASSNLKDSDGLTPKEVACDDDVRNLLKNYEK